MNVVIDVLDAHEKLHIDQVIAKFRDHPGALLGILEAVQSANPHKYLSMASLRYIAEETGVPPARIYSAATFYALFNLDPQGDNVICVCRGTACHTRGSRDLLDKVCLDLGLSDHEVSETSEADKLALTTPDRKFTDPHRCLLWPVRAGSGGRSQPPHPEPRERAHAAARSEGIDPGEEIMPRIQDIGAFNAVRESGLAKLMPAVPRLTVGMGTCGRGNGAEELYPRPQWRHSSAAGSKCSSPAWAASAPAFRSRWSASACPGCPLVVLHRVQAHDAGAHSGRHLHRRDATRSDLLQDRGMGSHHRLSRNTDRAIRRFAPWHAIPFFKGQKKIVLRNCGLINPSDIEEYIAVGGYQALYKVLIDGRKDAVIEQIKASRLRGPRRRRLPYRKQVGFSGQGQSRTPNTSSAMPMRATPART